MLLSEAEMAYTFDDFVLEPRTSLVESRKDPDISNCIVSLHYEAPIFSAPMSTITELQMAKAMYSAGAGSVIHRYMSLEDQVKIACQLHNDNIWNYFIAVGSDTDAAERVPALYANGVRNICVDVANGHNIHCWRTVATIKEKFPDIHVMAGNVCSYEGTFKLIEAGAELIRVGVGSGAVCTTRLVTGHGCPQLSAIEACSIAAQSVNTPITLIADGGIRHSGDIVKAIAAGARMVMIGSLLAGTTETPGQIIEENDRLYKYYQGMASEKARAGWFDKTKSGLPVEGISTKVPYTGKSAVKVVDGLCKSIKVGLAYSGAKNIGELQQVATWRRVTQAGYIEGTPHGKR